MEKTDLKRAPCFSHKCGKFRIDYILDLCYGWWPKLHDRNATDHLRYRYKYLEPPDQSLFHHKHHSAVTHALSADCALGSLCISAENSRRKADAKSAVFRVHNWNGLTSYKFAAILFEIDAFRCGRAVVTVTTIIAPIAYLSWNKISPSHARSGEWSPYLCSSRGKGTS